MKGFASDNYAPAHPEVLAAIAEANAEHADALRRRPVDRARRRAAARALRRAGAVVPRLQRHRRQRPVPARAVPPVGVRRLRRDARTSTSTRAARRSASPASSSTRSQTSDGKLTPELVAHAPRPQGRRARRPAARRSRSPRAPSSARATAPTSSPSSSAFARERDLLAARRRRAARERRRGAGRPAACGRDRRRRRRALLRRHEERPAARRGRRRSCDPSSPSGFAYLRKQTLQLASKGRYLAAQFVALLEGDLWQRSAAHANAMAARLAAAVRDVPGVRITQAVQANAVFAVFAARRHGGAAARLALLHLGRGDAAKYAGCARGTRRPTEVDAFAAAIERAPAPRPSKPSAG